MTLLQLTLCVLIGSTIAIQLPCDIFDTGSTPCVAAHSTVRALFAAFDGPLYQIKRSSDNTTLDINVVSKGGYADADAQVSCLYHSRNYIIHQIGEMAGKSKIYGCTTVGIFGTKPGGRYVWKVKLLQGKSICVGVINDIKCKND